MKNEIKQIGKIADEIENMFISKEMSLQELNEKFYNIVRKYGIKKSITTIVGSDEILKDTGEWLMLYNFFISRVVNFFQLNEFFGNVPKDLQ